MNLSIKDIDEFPNHPFNVNLDEEFLSSIKEKGILVPVIVRPKENGKYEMISGHRRRKASELLNLDTIPCVVRDFN